jgi:hypothetical protein
VRVCPAAGDEVALPAKQRLRLERESRPRRLGSERLSDASSVRSARVSFAARPVGGGSPAHAGGRGSPTPSSDAAAPTATPVVTGSGQRDTPTTRANSPPSTTARETNLAIPTLGKAADEFANPTPSNQRDRVPRAHETPWLTRSEKDAPTVLDCPRRLPTSDRPRTESRHRHLAPDVTRDAALTLGEWLNMPLIDGGLRVWPESRTPRLSRQPGRARKGVGSGSGSGCSR